LAQNGDASGLWAIGMAIANPFMDVARERGGDLGVPCLVAIGGGDERRLLRQVQGGGPDAGRTDPVAARRLWDVSEEMARP